MSGPPQAVDARATRSWRDATWFAVAASIAAALFLNGLLSAENIWPTPFLRPDHRLAPEFVAIWVIVLVGVAWRGGFSKRGLSILAAIALTIIIGRYADVTVPALFGRPLNLYWDGIQLFVFLDLAENSVPFPLIILGAVIIAATLYAAFWLVRLALARLARHAAPWALRNRGMHVLLAFAVASVVANSMHVSATWPYISKPVTPTYLRQFKLLASAWLPGGIDRVLPPSPTFEGDLSALNGANIKLFFLESYGAVVYDDAEIRASVAPAQKRFAEEVLASGRGIVSAMYRSPTFAGGSDLAHMTLLSGLDLSDPLRHDVLLTSDRPTLLDHLRKNGYDTVGLYPALSWDWPEKRFYNYDTFIDAPAVKYPGPKLGYWWIPDQYSIAWFEKSRQNKPAVKPHFLFFPTITTHIPFRPVPPYQADWDKMLTATPYDEVSLAKTLADRIDWLALREPYQRVMRYQFDWLAGYMHQPSLQDDLVILIGDHQPASSVTGPNASWDVPVHVVTSNRQLLKAFRSEGFEDGIQPPRRAKGGLDDLNRVLMRVFAGAPGIGPAKAGSPSDSASTQSPKS